MTTFNLKRFGMAMAEAVHADRKGLALNSMSRGRAQASTDHTMHIVRSWSTTENKGMSIDTEFVPPNSNTANQQEHVLGPEDHIQYLDEAVEASVEKQLKLPVSKVTELKKVRTGGVQYRSLKVGGEVIRLGPMDWSSVLAVVTGKAPKNVVAEGTWSFGKAGADDIIRIRSVGRNHITVIGEISAKALYKLV